MVGTTGFEPATSRTPSVRATRLRYVPTAAKISVSLVFEKRQESAQRIAQVKQGLAVDAGEWIDFGGARRLSSRCACFVQFRVAARRGGRIGSTRCICIVGCLRASMFQSTVSQMAARAGDREP